VENFHLNAENGSKRRFRVGNGQSPYQGPPLYPSHNLHLTPKYTSINPEDRGITWMSSKDKDQIQLLQGTLDLIVLRTLATMGSQHAYQIATRLQQISDSLLNLNQGTLYPALVRLEQYGWIAGTWGKTENNREAKYYQITKSGQKALGAETQKWRTMSALVERLLVEES
jgi:PadR family transcriptional regulator PadR